MFTLRFNVYLKFLNFKTNQLVSHVVFPYDLQWKEVEKAVRTVFKEMKNGNGGTPYVLFAKNPKEVKEGGREVDDEHS